MPNLLCTGCKLEKPEEAFNKSNKQHPYYERNGRRQRCKSCEHLYAKRRMDTLKEAIYDLLGHKCCRCGYADKRALQIDHVNGGGNREHRKIANPYKYYLKVLADTTGSYQILCANCNWIKRIEQREEPLAKIR